MHGARVYLARVSFCTETVLSLLHTLLAYQGPHHHPDCAASAKCAEQITHSRQAESVRGCCQGSCSVFARSSSVLCCVCCHWLPGCAFKGPVAATHSPVHVWAHAQQRLQHQTAHVARGSRDQHTAAGKCGGHRQSIGRGIILHIGCGSSAAAAHFHAADLCSHVQPEFMMPCYCMNLCRAVFGPKSPSELPGSNRISGRLPQLAAVKQVPDGESSTPDRSFAIRATCFCARACSACSAVHSTGTSSSIHES